VEHDAREAVNHVDTWHIKTRGREHVAVVNYFLKKNVWCVPHVGGFTPTPCFRMAILEKAPKVILVSHGSVLCCPNRYVSRVPDAERDASFLQDFNVRLSHRMAGGRRKTQAYCDMGSMCSTSLEILEKDLAGFGSWKKIWHGLDPGKRFGRVWAIPEVRGCFRRHTGSVFLQDLQCQAKSLNGRVGLCRSVFLQLHLPFLASAFPFCCKCIRLSLQVHLPFVASVVAFCC
jgi:hypothetical protein